MRVSLRFFGRMLLLTIALTAFLPRVTLAGTIDASRPTVFVTGANRGIGLAFAQHYTGTGWNVLAAVRAPDRATELLELAKSYEHLIIEQLDVTDNERIAALADAYRNTPIDVLINNAGVYGDTEKQAWGSIDAVTFHQVLAVNVFAPMKLAEAFSDHVAASEQKKIVSITSGAGSVSRDGRAGGGMFYGISKASLNMAMRQIRAELEGRDVIVALIAPGLVATDMLAVARPSLFANANTPTQSVVGIAAVIESLDESYDGRPRNYNGAVIPW
ncbi:MAG: SDR family oxidoreductase [Arenicellaceae bacterium]|nr:SDR family oxidoreductase [Arenicellaceae bacterium]